MTTHWHLLLARAALLAALVWAWPGAASARQVPTPAAVPVAPADTIRAPVAPLPAFFRSLVLPGWGQAILNRPLTGGLFMAWEGVTLSMMLKANREVGFLRATEASRVGEDATEESSRLRAKKAEREDWMVLLIFNHLFSGLEAYVSAHLWDFPRDVQVRAFPAAGGGAGLAVSVPFRLR